MPQQSIDPRARAEEAAYRRGADETAGALFEIVDDCDRALASLRGLELPESVRRGLEGIQQRLVSQFETLGYQAFDPLGEEFDPHRHEAVSAEPGPGRNGVVIRVHRRGWLHGEYLVRAAQVTVRQGEPLPEQQPAAAEAVGNGALDRRRRRPRRTGFLSGRTGEDGTT